MENDESRRLQVLKEVAHAFNRHDLDTVMSYFAEDAVLDMPRGPDPGGRRYVGQAAVREGLASRFALIPDVQYGDDRHWVCGNLGVSEWLLTGTTTAGARLAVRGCGPLGVSGRPDRPQGFLLEDRGVTDRALRTADEVVLLPLPLGAAATFSRAQSLPPFSR